MVFPLLRVIGYRLCLPFAPTPGDRLTEHDEFREVDLEVQGEALQDSSAWRSLLTCQHIHLSICILIQ